MRLKKICVLWFCFSMAFICAGCKIEEKQSKINEEINESENTTEIPKEYCYEAGNIKFNTSISVPEEVKNKGMKEYFV